MNKDTTCAVCGEAPAQVDVRLSHGGLVQWDLTDEDQVYCHNCAHELLLDYQDEVDRYSDTDGREEDWFDDIGGY